VGWLPVLDVNICGLEPDVASCVSLVVTTAWLSPVGQTGYGSWVAV
jgi:hypothetical protein